MNISAVPMLKSVLKLFKTIVFSTSFFEMEIYTNSSYVELCIILQPDIQFVRCMNNTFTNKL